MSNKQQHKKAKKEEEEGEDESSSSTTTPSRITIKSINKKYAKERKELVTKQKERESLYRCYLTMPRWNSASLVTDEEKRRHKWAREERKRDHTKSKLLHQDALAALEIKKFNEIRDIRSNSKSMMDRDEKKITEEEEKVEIQQAYVRVIHDMMERYMNDIDIHEMRLKIDTGSDFRIMMFKIGEIYNSKFHDRDIRKCRVNVLPSTYRWDEVDESPLSTSCYACYACNRRVDDTALLFYLAYFLMKRDIVGNVLNCPGYFMEGFGKRMRSVMTFDCYCLVTNRGFEACTNECEECDLSRVDVSNEDIQSMTVFEFCRQQEYSQAFNLVCNVYMDFIRRAIDEEQVRGISKNELEHVSYPYAGDFDYYQLCGEVVYPRFVYDALKVTKEEYEVVKRYRLLHFDQDRKRIEKQFHAVCLDEARAIMTRLKQETIASKKFDDTVITDKEVCDTNKLNLHGDTSYLEYMIVQDKLSFNKPINECSHIESYIIKGTAKRLEERFLETIPISSVKRDFDKSKCIGKWLSSREVKISYTGEESIDAREFREFRRRRDPYINGITLLCALEEVNTLAIENQGGNEMEMS